MNKDIHDYLEEVIEPWNEDVIYGLSRVMVPRLPSYLNKSFKSAIAGSSEGIEYHGLRILTPEEDYRTTYEMQTAKPMHDVAKSDFYKTEIMLSFKGQKLSKRYLYLPFVGQGGMTTISGTRYYINPVLSDSVITPMSTGVFVKVGRFKDHFTKKIVSIVCDGKQMSGEIIHSVNLFAGGKSVENTLGDIPVSTTLYLFAAYGVNTAFEKYANTDIKIGRGSNVKIPGYTVYESMKVQPTDLRNRDYYNPHDTYIAVPTAKDSRMAENLVTGLIYSLDVFPEQALELHKALETKDLNAETFTWKNIMGRIWFHDNYPPSKIPASMATHVEDVKTYMDSHSIDVLATIGIEVVDFLDFMAVITEEFTSWSLEAREYRDDIANKYLDINTYIGYAVSINFNKAVLEIKRKEVKRPLTYNDVDSVFKKLLKPKLPHRIISGRGVTIAVSSVDNTSDNMLPKITTYMDNQNRATGVVRSSNRVFPPALWGMRASHALVGTSLFPNKHWPTPLGKINTNIRIKSNGQFIFDKESKKQMKIIDSLLLGAVKPEVEINYNEVKEI